MITANELVSKIRRYQDNAARKEFAFFWKKIEDIVEAKVYEYKMQVQQELPYDFYIDLFDAYRLEYETLEYDKKDTDNLVNLRKHFKLFKAIARPEKMSESEVLLDDETWELLHMNNEEFIAADHKEVARPLNLKEGVIFSEVLRHYRLQLKNASMNPYEYERLEKLWSFFKTYVFRLIPDKGLIYEDDLLECLKFYVDKELSAGTSSHDKISRLKQAVLAFNGAFSSRIRYSDVGLSFDDLKDKMKNEEDLRTDEDFEALQKFRHVTHYYFDKLWKEKEMSRGEAYDWLAKSLFLPKDEAHIALFDEETCAKTILEVLHILKNL